VFAFLDKLPTILVLGSLVSIFIALRRHSTSVRPRLWIYSWALILAHLCSQIFEGGEGPLAMASAAIDLGALELAGIIFMISSSAFVERKARRYALLVLLGAPAVFHAVAATYGWEIPKTMAVALGVIFLTNATLSLVRFPRPTLYHMSVAAVLIAAGTWSVAAQLRGDPDPAAIAILTTSYGLCGVFYWKRYPRFSAGVLSVAGGFLAWGAVFPAAALLERFHPALKVNPELWNVPQYFVAFGMILTLLEEKSMEIERSSVRERSENLLLERLAFITSRLLRGDEPVGLSHLVARTVTNAFGFRRGAVVVARENGTLFLAGSRGYTHNEKDVLNSQLALLSISRLDEMRAAGTTVTGKVFCIAAGSMTSPQPAALRCQNLDCCKCTFSEDLVVPLISRQGSDLGWILLSEPAPKSRDFVPQVSRLDLLAGDFAGQIENYRLRRQLVVSEKLASIGQLVSGVIHELNNPLTAIMGNAEILMGEAKEESARRRIGKIGDEGRRMKSILDSLARFARPGRSQAESSVLAQALQDALQLRAYHVRKHDIEISLNLESSLPPLALGDDELKQILLNLLSNAIHAVENSAVRRIEIAAAHSAGFVSVRFEDSGAGFGDLQRVFDPFYSTKGVGKGTGLGLSICYGLMKNCGGEIHISNRQPSGACVRLDIPVAGQPVATPRPVLA
jgi:two-component system NtrC family sensor kinase